MKKKLKLLLLPLILIGMTACGTKSSSKTEKEPAKAPTLQAAIEKTNKAKSFHVEYKMDIGVESEGISMEMPITMGMDMDLNTKLVKANVAMKFLGMDINVDEYMDLNNNIIYVKDIGEENSWTKQKITPFWTDKVIEEVKGAKYIDETDTEYHYQAVVTPEDFQKNLSAMGETTEDMTLEKDVTVDYYVNKKDSYVSRMEADLKDAIKIEEDVEYTKLSFVLSVSELDKVSVKSIDQSIIDNAVEEEE